MYFIDGVYLQDEDALISVRDLSILRGFGVFDFLKTYQGKPFHLREHLLRLRYSAEGIGLTLPYSLEAIAEIVEHLLKRSKLQEAAIKILVTGGISPDQFTPVKPSLIAFAYPLAPCPQEFYEQGVNVVTTPLSRSLPTYKTLQYLPGIVAVQQGHAVQAKEAIYLSQNGVLLEGVTSNFFAFKQGVLHTCMSDAVLAGITREVVLQRLSQDFSISYEPVTYDDIPLLEEAFITASNKEILPVVQIDHTRIGHGRIGKNTQKIMTSFHQYTHSGHWPPLEIPRYETPLSQGSLKASPTEFLRQTTGSHGTLPLSVRKEAK